MSSHVPTLSPDDGVIDAVTAALGGALLDAREQVDEITLLVERGGIVGALRALRDTPGLDYQQLMEIAGVDYPERAERFEVVYHLLSLTRNRRIRVKVSTDAATPVPTVTGLWPVAGWLEREVFDMYGVAFSGHPDLRRILTDYGFQGHPQRKDFPLSGEVEMRYSEAEKRVVYEPVSLPQDFRAFDFLMPWEGAEYRLPGDEKAEGQAPGAPTPAAAPTPTSVTPVPAAGTPKTTDTPAKTGAGAPADAVETRNARRSASAKAGNSGGKATTTAEPELGPDGKSSTNPGNPS